MIRARATVEPGRTEGWANCVVNVAALPVSAPNREPVEAGCEERLIRPVSSCAAAGGQWAAEAITIAERIASRRVLSGIWGILRGPWIEWG